MPSRALNFYMSQIESRSREATSIAQKRAAFIVDPAKLDKRVADTMKEHLPPETKIKNKGFATKTAAVAAAFDKDDPRSTMGTDIKAKFNALITDPSRSSESAEILLAESFRASFKERKQGIHQYTARVKHSPFRIWNAKPTMELAGQKQWEAKHKPTEYMSMGGSFLTGAAFSGAGFLAKKALVGAGIGAVALAPIPGARPLAAALYAGATAVPTFMAFDKIMNVLDKKGVSDSPIVRGVMAAGAVAVGEKLAAGGAKKAFSWLRNVMGRKSAYEGYMSMQLGPGRFKELGPGGQHSVVQSVNWSRLNNMEQDAARNVADRFWAMRHTLPGPHKALPIPRGLEKTKRRFIGHSAPFTGTKYTDSVIAKQEAYRHGIREKTGQDVIEDTWNKYSPPPPSTTYKGLSKEGKKNALDGPPGSMAENIKNEGRKQKDFENFGKTSQPQSKTPKAAPASDRIKNAKNITPQDDMSKINKPASPTITPAMRRAEGKKNLAWMSDSTKSEVDDIVKYTEKSPETIAAQAAHSKRAALEEAKALKTDVERTGLLDTVKRRAFSVEMASDDVKVSNAATDKFLKSIGLVGLTGLTTIAALGASAIAPSEAEAGMSQMAAGLAKPVVKAAKNGDWATVGKYLKDGYKTHLISPLYEKGATAIPYFQKAFGSVHTVPEKMNVMRKNLSNFKGHWYDKGISPHVRNYRLWTESRIDKKTGVEIIRDKMMNPIVELVNYINTAQKNSSDHLMLVGNIFKDVKGYRSATKEISEEMAPIIDKYFLPMSIRNHYEQGAKHYRGMIRSEFKKYQRSKGKYGERDAKSAEAAADKYLRKAEAYEKDFAKSDSLHALYVRDSTNTYKRLAARHPAARIFFAAQDTATHDMYPWMKAIGLSYDEKVAVTRVKKMMEMYKGELKAAGHHTKKEPFMHWAPHERADFKQLDLEINRIHTGATRAPFTRVHSRSLTSMPMMPDAEYSLTSYIPDINKRIETSKFWKWGVKDTNSPKAGWYSISRSPEVQGNHALKSFFDDLAEGMRPQDRTSWDRWAERIYGLEVARLLAFSPSVAVKHAMKPIADLRMFGGLGIEAIPEAGRRWARSVLGAKANSKQLEAMGMTAKQFDHAVDSQIRQKRIMDVITDSELISRAPNHWWDKSVGKYINKFNDKANFMVAQVENFDRGQAFISSMLMAANKGMTTTQANYALFDTILKVNFLSGDATAPWLRNPTIRLFAMFQNTPMKLAETRLMIWKRGGKNIIEGGGYLFKDMQGKSVDKMLTDIARIRKDVAHGRDATKWEIIKTLMTRDRDIFGTPMSRQLMRDIQATGMVVGGGYTFFDATLWDHVAHVPLVVPSKEVTLRAAPPVEAVLAATQAIGKEDKDPFTEAWRSWAGSKGPLPLSYYKTVDLFNRKAGDYYGKDNNMASLARKFVGWPHKDHPTYYGQ